MKLVEANVYIGYLAGDTKNEQCWFSHSSALGRGWDEISAKLSDIAFVRVYEGLE